MAEIEAPAVLQEATAPQQIAPAEPASPFLADAAMGRLDNDLANGSMSDADLRQTAKRAYEDLLQKTGGPNQAAASLSILQQSGALNAGITNQFRSAMTIANGNSDKFAEEIVKRRQGLSQLMQATTPPAQPAAGATAGTTPATGADNPLSKLFESDFMKPFKQFLESMLSAFNGGKKVSLDTLFAGNKPATANPNAPATTTPAQTASTSTGQTTPTATASTPPQTTETPSTPAASGPDQTVAGTSTTRVGGTAYDVTPLPGGESHGVRLEDGSSNVRAVFGHNSDPPASAITVRNGTDLPTTPTLITAALNTTTPTQQNSGGWSPSTSWT